MNRFCGEVIAQFLSAQNQSILLARLQSYTSEISADELAEHAMQYVGHIRRDLEQTDSIGPADQIGAAVHYSNEQFIAAILPKYIALNPMPTARFTVGDTGPAQLQRTGHPDDILDQWRCNAGRGVQMRDDPAEQPYCPQSAAPGIEFCDQSDSGMQQLDQFDTPYARALNALCPDEEYLRTPFGVSTPAADARLLSRRIFRGGAGDIENGIPAREIRLHRRAVDRDISEGLGVGRDDSRGYIAGHYDMSDLLYQIDKKRSVQNG